MLRTRILVQTRDGTTIEGALVRIDAGGIVLAPACYENQDLAGVGLDPPRTDALDPGPEVTRGPPDEAVLWVGAWRVSRARSHLGKGHVSP